MTGNQTMDHMFDFDTFIHVMGHVPVVVCVEYLQSWWNSIYATSLIVLVSMRCQPSWIDSSVPSDVFILYGDLILLYIVRGDDHMNHMFIMHIHGHCTMLYPGLLYFIFVVICWDLLLYCTGEWLVFPPGSSLLHFWDWYNVFLPSFYHTIDHIFMAVPIPMQTIWTPFVQHKL